MAFVTGAGYKVEVDLADAATTYVQVDILNADESMNEVVDTFYRLSQGGFADNVVTAIDPEFSVVMKAESTDATIEAIASKRLTLNRNFSLKITDNFTAEVITADAVFTSIGSTRTVDVVTEIPVTFKLRGEPTIA